MAQSGQSVGCRLSQEATHPAGFAVTVLSQGAIFDKFRVQRPAAGFLQKTLRRDAQLYSQARLYINIRHVVLATEYEVASIILSLRKATRLYRPGRSRLNLSDENLGPEGSSYLGSV